MLFTDSPRDTLLALADHHFLMSGGPTQQAARRRHEKPGTTVMNLPASVRERLQRLRSEDIADVRWPPWDEARNWTEI